MQSQNNSFASSSTSKGRSPGERSSPSTPGASGNDSRQNNQPEQTGTGSTNGDGNNQQDWTFEEQFKQVRKKEGRYQSLMKWKVYFFDVEIESRGHGAGSLISYH